MANSTFHNKDKNHTTVEQRKERGQRVSTIDAHNERVKIKDEHPEHPTLTSYALSILFPKDNK